MSYTDYQAARANLPVNPDRAKVRAYRSEWSANKALAAPRK